MTNAEKYEEIMFKTFELMPHKYGVTRHRYGCPPSMDGKCKHCTNCRECEKNFWEAEYKETAN